jgi:hypothetical protein
MQESEDEDEDDEDEEDEDEDEEEEDEDYQEPEQLHTASKRKKKQDEVSEVSSEAPPTPSTTSEEDESETAATSVDDGLPHPRVSDIFNFFLLPSFILRPSIYLLALASKFALTIWKQNSHLSHAANSLSAPPPNGRRFS